MQIREKVEVLCLEVSRHEKCNFPNVEPMDSSGGKPYKCRGRLGNLTQIGAEERMSVAGLKDRV
jgi:hypothetical protein